MKSMGRASSLTIAQNGYIGPMESQMHTSHSRTNHPHRRNSLSLAVLALIAGCVLTACQPKTVEIHEAPNSEVCVELLMSVHSAYAEMERLPQPPMDFEAIREMALSSQCLEAAMRHRKYVAHYYQHLEDRDVEIVPVKFPLYWKLDSTTIQTEGTYLVEFKSQSDLQISFQCDPCSRIDTAGKLLASRVETMNTEFASKTDQRHSNLDWTFTLQPRKADLSKEVGKSYLVRIESRESYLAKARERIRLVQSNGNNLRLQYSDGLDYRATDFANSLARSLAMVDKAKRDSANTLRLGAVQAEIAQFEAGMAGSGDGNPELDSLKREENKLKIELAAILPRILVIGKGAACGK